MTPTTQAQHRNLHHTPANYRTPGAARRAEDGFTSTGVPQRETFPTARILLI